MELDYSPGAYSLSPHIVAREAGLPLTAVRVDTENRKTESGDDYLFTVLGWTRCAGPDLARWPARQAYVARVAARPQVQVAMKEEGLLK